MAPNKTRVARSVGRHKLPRYGIEMEDLGLPSREWSGAVISKAKLDARREVLTGYG